MKILVVKFRRIGDTLLSTPLLSNLASVFPNAEIHYALNAGCEGVFEGNECVSKIHIFANPRAFFAKIYAKIKFIFAIRREKFDIVINSTEGKFGVMLGVLSGAKTLVSFPTKSRFYNTRITHEVKRNWQTHMVEQDLNLLRALGFEPVHKRVEMCGVLPKNASLPEKFALFCVSASEEYKCVSLEMMANLARFVMQRGLSVVVSGAPNEHEKVGRFVALCGSGKSNLSAGENGTKVVNLCGQLSLTEFAGVARQAAIYVGVDTASSHIAASQNTPCVVMFGSIPMWHWGAWDNEVAGLYEHKSGVQRVGRHVCITPNLPCVPCAKKGCKESGFAKCLREETGEFEVAVKAEILKTLKNVC